MGLCILFVELSWLVVQWKVWVDADVVVVVVFVVLPFLTVWLWPCKFEVMALHKNIQR